MSKEVIPDSSKKEQEPEPESIFLKIEEGQKLIKGYMKPKIEQPELTIEKNELSR